MVFEVGKYYKHTTGICLAILTKATTTMYGETLIAEQTGGCHDIIAVGSDESSAVNFHEITEKEWMEEFNWQKEDAEDEPVQPEC